MPEAGRGSQFHQPGPALPLFPPLGSEGDDEGPRRSQRLAVTVETRLSNTELDECRKELLTKTQGEKEPKDKGKG